MYGGHVARLWGTCRAGCKYEKGGVVRQAVDGCKLIGRHIREEVHVFRIRRPSVDGQNTGEFAEVVADGFEFRQVLHIGNERTRTAGRETIGQRFLTEEREKWHGDEAGLVAGDMGDCRLGTLRQ